MKKKSYLTPRVPLRVVISANTSTIQVMPGQFSLI